MSASVSLNTFREDKNSFFSSYKAKTQLNDDSFSAIDQSAAHADYNFLLKNKGLIEAEFATLFKVLKKQKEQENNQAFWLYCYYCASLLESFHDAYRQPKNASEYAEIKLQIKELLTNTTPVKTVNNLSEQSFIDYLSDAFKRGFAYMLSVPFHVTSIRDQVNWINMYRIYWIFVRFTLTEALTVANNLHWIDKLDAALGTHTDLDKILKGLQVPTMAMNYLSVGLFAVRFLANMSMLIKHTFFPSEAEANTTMMERFTHEFNKRHWMFLNDLAWGTVNLATNFTELTKISGPVAFYIIAGFLVFDLAMILYKTHSDKKEYMLKKEHLLQQLRKYSDPSNKKDSDSEKLAHVTILAQQIAELDRSWNVTESTLYFYTAAALTLGIGFSITLMVSSPILTVAFYFVALVGVAMYLSADIYGNYKDKSLLLESMAQEDENRAAAIKEYEIARNEFIFSMVKNTTVPLVLITTLIFSWPAAVALTAVYIGYEVYHAYGTYSAKKEIAQLNADVSEAVVEDDEDDVYGEDGLSLAYP